MNFRHDINGLRAVAVTAVVAFHFFPQALPGGFAGVDVFFVISGYLMTAIISQQLVQGAWSFRRFYAARAWRLVPAVLVLCAVLLACAAVLLLPGDFYQLSKQAIATLVFASNWLFYREAGYFDADSHTKLLLHTWSLSVEWQFYLLYPLLLVAVWRLAGARALRWAVLALALLSLAWAQWSSLHAPSLAYYALPSRAWELLAGALVFWFPLPARVTASRAARRICVAALLTMVLTMLWVHSRHPWPGLWALPVVVATGVLLGMQYQGFALYRYQWVQWLGNTSYSVYLWHWPVYAYLHMQQKAQDTPWLLLGLALSLAMGALSYYGVERPLLKKPQRAALAHGTAGSETAATAVEAPTPSAPGAVRRSKAWALPGGFALVLLAACTVYQQRGFAFRLGPEMQTLSAITNVYNHFQFQSGIRHGQCHSAALQARTAACWAPQREQVFIWGDSYAASLYPGLQHVAAQRYPGTGISQMTDGNGPPFFSASQTTDEGWTLEQVNEERLRTVQRLQPRTVVMSWMVTGSNGISDPQAAVQALQRTVQAIQGVAPQTRIVLVGPVPHWKENLVAVVLKYWKMYGRPAPAYLQTDLDPNIQDWDRVLAQLVPALGVHYVSAYQALCPAGQGCRVYLEQDIAKLTAVDWGHLTQYGSIYLAEQIAAQIFD